MYNEICDNGPDLFNLDVGQEFRCDFSASRFAELQEVLLTPWEEPPDSTRCTSSRSCTENAALPGLQSEP